MNTQKDERRANQPRSRVKRRKGNILPYVIIILALAGAALYFYFQKNFSSTYLDYGTAVGTSQIPTIPDAATTVSTDQTDSTEKATKTTSHPDIPKIDPTSTVGIIPDTDLNPAHQQQDNQQQDNQQQIDENPGKYLAAIDTLNRFYTHLDQQPYIKDFQLTEPSREHFTKLIGKLLENPPIVARETDDLFTLLKNTAHFFRILGKDNIILLKGILDREKDSLEDMLKAFYTLTEKPQYLEQEYGLMVNPEALYDYASFLIHTMGAASIFSDVTLLHEWLSATTP